ncbi:hypothetical protein KJ855_01780 [Patescibacteria group bacterium]|nr:hypothetical protein [Patescibacteria group bacterium]
MTHNKKEGEPCCPKFDTSKWDKKAFTWKEKKFIRDTFPLFMHMPWPPMIGKSIGKLWKMATEAKAAPDLKDFLCLSHDSSPWKGEHYMAVTKEVEGADNVTLSGDYMSMVFDGPYNAVPKYMKELDEYLESEGKKAKDYYFYYTTCPKCAKIYGHNYMVGIAEV